MFKKIARTSAIVLSLTVLAVPAAQMHGQAPVVTGGNPVPTGEPGSDVSSSMIVMMVISALSTV